MTEEVKKTKAELVEAMKRLFIEIDSLKEDAKERGMPAALMAKVAKLQASMKVDDVLEKNAEFEALVDEVRNS